MTKTGNLGDNEILMTANMQMVEIPNVQEYLAWEQLGPLARYVINFEMPVKWSSYLTLYECRQMGLNPRDPRTDESLALWLRSHAKRILAHLQQEREHA